MKLKKRGQEEMVGFILIVVIVSVIILVFLGFILTSHKNEAVQSYEVQGFLQSVLQYTSGCEDYLGFLSISDLMSECDKGKNCLNGEDSCVVLEDTLKDLAEKSWIIKENSPVKGYELKVTFGTGAEKIEKINLKQGSETGNYKGDFAKTGGNYEISFKVYE